MCRNYEPQDTGLGRDIAIINKQGWGEGQPLHNVVHMFNLYHEAILKFRALCVRSVKLMHVSWSLLEFYLVARVS
jgi:hypothetical protein